MNRDLSDDLLRREVTITVPLSAVLALLNGAAPEAMPAVGRYAIIDDCLPEIGQAWINTPGNEIKDGIYAGLTLRHNAPMALVLLPGDEELTWSKAGEWAKAQGGELPSRADALMLWQNVPKQFQETYYWTSKEYAGIADYAWVASFLDGHQDSIPKSSVCRCRAVRRVAI